MATSTRSLGRDYLISQLEAGGVEVSEPERYLGADLVARVYQGSNAVACPIKLVTSEAYGFTLTRKWEKIPNLLLAYAWNAISDAPELHALSYSEAFAFLESRDHAKRDHTKTDSWIVEGIYSLKVSPTWCQLLARYRMQPKDWAAKISSLSRT